MDDTLSSTHTMDAPPPSNPTLPLLTPDILERIFTSLDPDDPLTIPTLVACQLVSHSFSTASRASNVWSPLLFPWDDVVLIPIQLPSYGTVEDQTLLDSVLLPLAPTPHQSFQYYRARKTIDSLVHKYFELLVPLPSGKLGPFEVLSAIGEAGFGVLWEEHHAAVQGRREDALVRRYWLNTFQRHYMHRECAERLRSFDLASPPADFERDNFLCALEVFSQVAEGCEIVGHVQDLVKRIEARLEHLAHPFDEAPDGQDPIEYFSERMRNICVLICMCLEKEGFIPPTEHTESSVTLDMHFTNAVFDLAAQRTQMYYNAMRVRDGNLRTSDRDAYRLVMQRTNNDLGPTVSLRVFMLLFLSVATRIRNRFNLNLKLTEIASTVRIKRWYGPNEPQEGDWYFDVRSLSVRHRPWHSSERSLILFRPFDVIQLLTYDINKLLLTDPQSQPVSKVSRADATYSVLFVRALVTRPWEGLEAVFRISDQALKLASYVRKHFPLDVGIVDSIVKPLVMPDMVKKLNVVCEVIRKEEERLVVNQVEKEKVKLPTFKVGEVFLHRRERWLGVIVGWELEFTKKTGDLYDKKAFDDLGNTARGASQPFYQVVTALTTSPYNPDRYIAEDDIDATVPLNPDEANYFHRTPLVGRFFSSEHLGMDGKLRFVMSNETKARFPDDEEAEAGEEEKETV